MLVGDSVFQRAPKGNVTRGNGESGISGQRVSGFGPKHHQEQGY